MIPIACSLLLGVASNAGSDRLVAILAIGTDNALSQSSSPTNLVSSTDELLTFFNFHSITSKSPAVLSTFLVGHAILSVLLVARLIQWLLVLVPRWFSLHEIFVANKNT